MKVTLSLRKSIDENAKEYYEKAKKAKKKLKGALEALTLSEKKLSLVDAKKEKVVLQEVKVKRKTAWYEKFRWFFTSDGFLCIGGRDATTNEIVVKKHAEPSDLILHTDMAGSPFVVIKSEGKKISDTAILEAAQFVSIHARAWKLGMGSMNVFYVTPQQVSKKANTGEYMSKGSFMIRGETHYVHASLEAFIGIKEGVVMVGPQASVKKYSEKEAIKVLQGNDKTSDVAKKIKSLLGGELDDIIAALPAGGVSLGKK